MNSTLGEVKRYKRHMAVPWILPYLESYFAKASDSYFLSGNPFPTCLLVRMW